MIETVGEMIEELQKYDPSLGIKSLQKLRGIASYEYGGRTHWVESIHQTTADFVLIELE